MQRPRGSATITGVGLYRARGAIRLVDWAVRRRTAHDTYSQPTDATPGTARRWPGFTHAPITSPCDGQGGYTELAVSTRLASGKAVANGLNVRYKAQGKAGTAFVPFSITECTSLPCPIMAYRR